MCINVSHALAEDCTAEVILYRENNAQSSFMSLFQWHV